MWPGRRAGRERGQLQLPPGRWCEPCLPAGRRWARHTAARHEIRLVHKSVTSLDDTSGKTEFPACLLHTLVVDEASIGAGPCDDESGPEESGRLLQLLVVYQACLRLSDGEGQITGRGGREGERSAAGIVLLNVISACSKQHDSHPACKASTQSRWRWLRSSWCPSCSRGWGWKGAKIFSYSLKFLFLTFWPPTFYNLGWEGIISVSSGILFSWSSTSLAALVCKVQVSLWSNVNVLLHPAGIGSLSIKHQTGIVWESKTSSLFVLDKEQASIINKLIGHK